MIYILNIYVNLQISSGVSFYRNESVCRLRLIRQVKQGGKSYQWNGPTAECFLAIYQRSMQRAIHRSSNFYDVFVKIKKLKKNK